MKSSINHPWAISDKYVNRYGKLWSELDFEFNSKIATEQFKNDPMNVEAGSLVIDGRKLDLKYKDLISYAKSSEELFNTVRTIGSKNPNDLYEITIKGRVFNLKRHEVSKLASTLNDSVNAIAKRYELGLYL